jgi:hypothetical protein
MPREPCLTPKELHPTAPGSRSALWVTNRKPRFTTQGLNKGNDAFSSLIKKKITKFRGY